MIIFFIDALNFGEIMEFECPVFTVVGDYRHSHPKSETWDSNQRNTTDNWFVIHDKLVNTREHLIN